MRKFKDKLQGLGGGLYEMPQERAPMPLGSGLFGVTLPPAAEPHYNTPGQGWVSAEGGQGYADGQAMDVAQPGAGQGAQGVGGLFSKEGFEGLLGDPRFVMGLSLLSNMHERDAMNKALQSTMAMQGMTQRGRLAERGLSLDEAKMRQARELAGLEHERGMGNLEVNRQNAATAQRGAELEARKLAAQEPYWQAQSQNMGAQADMERQKLEQTQRRMQMEQQILQQVLGGSGGLFAATPQTPPVQGQPQSLPGDAGQPQSLPSAAGQWSDINRVYAAGQPARENDRLRILQEELAATANPEHRAMLERDIARTGGGMRQSGVMPQAGGADGIALGIAASAVNPQLGSAIQQGLKMRADQAHRQQEYGYKERELSQGDARIMQSERGMALQEGQAARQAAKGERERKTEVADLDTTYRQAVDSMERTGKLADELINHKGLDAYEGLSGLAGVHKLTQAGRDADAKFESLKSRLVVDTMKSLKEMSSTGSTGFGSLSNQENTRLETFVTNLKAAQSKEQLQSALKDIRDWSRNAVDLHRQRYEEVRGAYGETPTTSPAPVQPKARQQGFERVSPREVKGSIKPAAPAGVKFLGFE